MKQNDYDVYEKEIEKLIECTSCTTPFFSLNNSLLPP